MKLKLLTLFLLLSLSVFCQDIVVTVPSAALNARKYVGEKLIIPIDITMELSAGSVPAPTETLTIPLAVTISSNGLPASMTFSDIDFALITLEGTVPTVSFTSATPSRTQRVYVIVPAAVLISSNKAVMLQVIVNGKQALTKQLFIEPANDVIYSLTDYCTPSVKLGHVSKVESIDNILIVSGYVTGGYTKRKVLLEQGEVLAIKETDKIFSSGYINSVPFSLVSVPFKIRPKTKVTLNNTGTPIDTEFRSMAMSGINNLGINIDLIKRTTDRYFSNGKKATHKKGIGLIITPGVEEFSASVIKDNSLVGDEKSKQFYVSVGISALYAYNGITFFVVPAGIDWAPSQLGKQWIYNKKYWWGFGIGVSPTILAQVFNK